MRVEPLDADMKVKYEARFIGVTSTGTPPESRWRDLEKRHPIAALSQHCSTMLCVLNGTGACVCGKDKDRL